MILHHCLLLYIIIHVNQYFTGSRNNEKCQTCSYKNGLNNKVSHCEDIVKKWYDFKRSKKHFKLTQLSFGNILFREEVR